VVPNGSIAVLQATITREKPGGKDVAGPGPRRRLRTLQGRIDCGHAALHKVAAQEDHAVGGTGQCARISHLIEMPVVKRMIFSNNSNDLRKIYHTLSCILKKTAFRLVTRLSIGL